MVQSSYNEADTNSPRGWPRRRPWCVSGKEPITRRGSFHSCHRTRHVMLPLTGTWCPWMCYWWRVVQRRRKRCSFFGANPASFFLAGRWREVLLNSFEQFCRFLHFGTQMWVRALTNLIFQKDCVVSSFALSSTTKNIILYYTIYSIVLHSV